MKSVILWVLLATLLFGVGLGGGIFWGKREIARLEQSCSKTSEQMRRRLEEAQRRGADERVRADRMQRLKYDLEQEVAKLKEELDTAKAQGRATADTTQQKLAEAEKRVAELTEKESSAKKRLSELETDHKQLNGQLTQAVAGQQQTQKQNEDLQQQLTSATQQFDRCRNHNAELVRVVDEMLKAYQEKGVFSALLEKEPLTGIKQVEVEHLIQTYQQETRKNTLREPKP